MVGVTRSDSTVSTVQVDVHEPKQVEPRANHSYRQFKLISVTFKEAALDSPSFRASVNHLDLQLLNTEKWLLALTASLLKIPLEVNELRSFLNSFLEYLVPLFLQDGLLDQEYTVSSLNSTKSGLKTLWNLALSLVEVNMANLELLRDEIVERIASYKRLRKQFDAAQEKYDQFLSLFMALSKLKEAAMIMEDLLQVFAVRKEYIQLSLELTMKISDLSNFINERLTLLNFLLWHEKTDKFSGNPLVLGLFDDFWQVQKRIQCWSENYRKAMGNLTGDLLIAKKHIEDRTVTQFSPSSSLDDYRPLLINARNLSDVDEPSAEIYGYLFLKTWTGKSTKPIWVKRWAFIQGGVFGFLVLNPSHSSVQETDKIGVLLCNAKYTPNEDRRFCFEVRTIDTTLVLQAETLTELKCWLKVFDNAQVRILDTEDPMHELFTIASGRYPPLVTEFQSSINTVTDREITSAKIVNTAGQIITSSRLSSHLEKNEKLFQKYIYNQIAQIYLPFVTDTSKSSLIAYSLTGSTAVPTALSANIWGSLNWGVNYMNDLDPSDVYEAEIPDEPFVKQVGNGIKYPRNFPNLWLPRDIQLRALFESSVGPQECCLVSFNSLLSPNSRQELRGTTFFTQKSIYSYIHSLGFVSLSKASITKLVEAQCTKKKNYDLLKVVNLEGSLRAKLFLDDGELVAKKLNMIFKNAASDLPVGLNELINRILEIDNAHNLEKAKRKHKLIEDEPREPVTNTSSFDFRASPDPSPAKALRYDFTDEMPLMGEHVIKLPPKAVFHLFFGARSTILEESFPSVRVRMLEHNKWMKDPENDNILTKEFITEYNHYGRKRGRAKVKYILEEFQDNEYYNCSIVRSYFKMNYGPRFKFCSRMVLIGIEGGQTRLRYYCDVQTESKSLFSNIVRRIGTSYIQSFLGALCRKADEAAIKIGHSGKILKAIYVYGKIEVTDTPYETPQVPFSEMSWGTVLRLFWMGTMTSATRRFFATIYFLLSATKIIFQSLSAHRLLVGIIFLLSIMNIMLGARSTQHYWNAREAKSLARDVVTFEPMMIERAIYLKDIHELINNKEILASSDSTCFQTFRNMSFVLNFNQPGAWSSSYHDDLTRTVATKLRKSLQDIGIRRNELLVNLRMLNALEEEIAQGEWKNWLVNELEKCDHLKHLPLVEDPVVHDQEFVSALESLSDFCSSCAKEMDVLLEEAKL